MKSGKTNQNGKEELRKTQKSKKSSKLTQKLKRAREAQNQHTCSKSILPLTLSMQTLPLR
jgi:ribosomal protein L32